MSTTSDARPSREKDFHAWALDQAERLRAFARTRPNEPVDWGLLAEEVEDMGAGERQRAESYLRLVISHLLKIDHATDAGPLRHWAAEVRVFRARLAQATTPSIETRLRAELETIYAAARGEAIARPWEDVDLELRASHGCPYAWDEIVGGWMPDCVAALPEPPPRKAPSRRRG